MARRVLRPHEKTAPHPALSEPAAVPYNSMASVAALDAAVADSRSASEARQRAELYRQQLRDGEWTAERVVRPRAEVAEQYGIDFARSNAAERTRRNAEMLRALQEGGRIEMDAPPMEWDVRRQFAVRVVRNNTGEALRPGQLVHIHPEPAPRPSVTEEPRPAPGACLKCGSFVRRQRGLAIECADCDTVLMSRLDTLYYGLRKQGGGLTADVRRRENAIREKLDKDFRARRHLPPPPPLHSFEDDE